MKEGISKSLKKTFSFLFGLQIFLVVFLVVLIVVLYRNQMNLAESRDRYFNSYILADELRQSSDDLTRLVRSYVATGNPEFEREYFAVLDIRDGKIARPVNYNRIYWDFFAVTGQKPREDGDRISLRELMIKEGFASEELAKLELAQQLSDSLVSLEREAMYAMKGLFADTEGNFTVRRTPDQDLAARLVNDENYYRLKAEIMRPIDDFYQMFQSRTQEAVAKYLRASQILFIVAIFLGFLILLISIVSFIIISKQLLDHMALEKDLLKLQSELEKKVQERTAQLARSEIAMKASLEESERLNKLMIGRELKMIELKNQIRNDKKTKK